MEKPTRVKYKLNGGVYRCTSKFLGNEGSLLTVTIDPTTYLVQLIRLTDSGEELVDHSTEESFAKAKTKAKEMLKVYGVVFLEEVRRKKTV
jgi:hypothetical protein